jgi:hypothetical protein
MAEEFRQYAGVIIGKAEVGPLEKPEPITRWGTFIVKYGGFLKSKYLGRAVSGFLENGASKCYVIRVANDEGYIRAIDLLDSLPEILFVAAPGNVDAKFHDAIKAYCTRRKDRYAILDLPEDIDLSEKGLQELPEVKPSEHYAYYYPWLYMWDYKAGDMYVPPSGHLAGVYALNAQKQRRTPPEIEGAAIAGARSIKYRISEEQKAALAAKGIGSIIHDEEAKLRVYPPAILR